MTNAIQIDGSLGEGGGQILRSSLTLSLVTGRPVVIHKRYVIPGSPAGVRERLADAGTYQQGMNEEEHGG